MSPGWGHDGVAVGGDCMTCSVGFRAPAAGELARELLVRLADEDADPALYRDPAQAATATPAAVPAALEDFARRALQRHLAHPLALARALGEVLSEPKPKVWFEARDAVPAAAGALRLDARTRMMYDAHHVFINGESFLARGRDARLLREMADTQVLTAVQRRQLSPSAQSLLEDWLSAGWLHGDER